MTAEEWNGTYSVGTPVIYSPVKGGTNLVVTRTRSRAWELGDGTPVVLVVERTGGVALSHLVAKGQQN